jgi:2-desacetyl-2-hydroxyethyl bacteriochlorophyllide A dehydrogenase
MRAAVLGESPWALRTVPDWPEPVAGPGQVLVRVRGVGICGSDLALLSGARRPPSFPWVPGHEAAGQVVAAGPGVPAGRVGQRVVIEPNVPCFACLPCRAGLTSACPNRVSLGFTAPGLLAELVAVPSRFAWEVPAHWSDEDAVCAEPLTVALAAIRRAEVQPGERCLVVGAGSQGALLCVALLSSRGVTPHVLEPQQGRRGLAAALGAVEAGPDDGEFRVVFETSASPAALGEAIRRASAGARVVLIGLANGPVLIDAETVVRRQLRIEGSLTYDHPGDFATTVAAERDLRPGRVLRARYALKDAATAFGSARGVPGKTWIEVG